MEITVGDAERIYIFHGSEAVITRPPFMVAIVVNWMFFFIYIITLFSNVPT